MTRFRVIDGGGEPPRDDTSPLLSLAEAWRSWPVPAKDEETFWAEFNDLERQIALALIHRKREMARGACREMERLILARIDVLDAEADPPETAA